MPNLQVVPKRHLGKKNVIIMIVASIITAAAVTAAVYVVLKNSDNAAYTKVMEEANRYRSESHYSAAAIVIESYAVKARSQDNKLKAYTELGTIYETAADPARALAAYKQAYIIAPNDLNVIVGMARSAESIKDNKLAAQFYEVIVKRYKQMDQRLYGADLKEYEKRLAKAQAEL